MMFIKTKIATLALPLCLIISQPILAEVSPYIGYEHNFIRYEGNNFSETTIVKYSPRLYLGITPIASKRYQFGAEIGYTLPSSSKYRFYDFKEKRYHGYTFKSHTSDLYLTVYKPISDNAHWFLKPGVEILHQDFGGIKNNELVYFPIVKTGIGYVFNNNLSVNLVTGSRFDSIINKRHKGNAFLFTSNIQYKW